MTENQPITGLILLSDSLVIVQKFILLYLPSQIRSPIGGKGATVTVVQNSLTPYENNNMNFRLALDLNACRLALDVNVFNVSLGFA